jgi:ferritin-like metal-binding protein YciE
MKRNEERSTSGRSDKGNAADDNSEMVDNELHELFLDQLADILNAEQQLTKALPRMAEAANSVELTAAFESHLAETENHITRLEEVFTSLEAPVNNKKCKAMEGLLQEGREMMAEMEGSPALDAALIAAAQKVEHYEIASYGTVCAWAEHMGHDEAVQLLTATLDEEKAADEKLTAIAQSGVNASAH